MIGKQFITRQQSLLQQIGKDSIAIVFAAKEPRHHRKTIYPYHQDNNFYYLTGFPESEAIAVFVPDREEGEYILFSQDKNLTEELWTGTRIGQLRACEDYGANQAFPISDAHTMLPKLIAGHERIYYNIDDHEDHEYIMQWIRQLADQERSGINIPTDFINISKVTHEMRMYKDEQELILMRKAADISATGHIRAMQVCRPGMMEYELEAELLHEFVRNGGRSPAFECIVAGGINACTLHYTQNNTELKDGDLVLVDAGVEYQYYAGDITRTFPINGCFSPEQKAVYQAVLATQIAVIEHIRPGVTWLELQHLSERIITEQLIALGLLTGKLNDLLAKQAFKPFYMHRFGHWLGLEAHDVGKYKINDAWRKLEPNMVFTVEPGIYIPANMPQVDTKWWNIGVRIEDEVLVTEHGCEVLTAAVPKEISDIEEIMQS